MRQVCSIGTPNDCGMDNSVRPDSTERDVAVAAITMVGRLIGALGAAMPEAIDLLYYTEGAPPVKKIALTHMAINLTAIVLHAINVWLRVRGPGPMAAGMSALVLLSIVGVALIAVPGWLGGQMVHVYGAGVEGRE